MASFSPPRSVTPDGSPPPASSSLASHSGGSGYRQLRHLSQSTTEMSASGPPQEKTSTRIAILIFFKGLFGAGVLAIPGAFGSTGVPLGLLIFLAVCTLCLGTMLMLLRCKVSISPCTHALITGFVSVVPPSCRSVSSPRTNISPHSPLTLFTRPLDSLRTCFERSRA